MKRSRVLKHVVAPRLYGPADVARELGVTKSTVSNWLVRHPNSVPTPDYMTGAETPLWNTLAAWKSWHAEHKSRI